MPDTFSRCRKFALAVQAVFEEGLLVNQDSQHFIFSTVSISDIRELETLIADPANCESDSLIELIYFPDEDIQIRLEDRLQSERFQQRDEQTILKQLLSCRGKTLVRFDGLEPVLVIATPESGARAFLSRLNITRDLDPELIRIMGQTAGKTQVTKYSVWLRNMVMELRDREIDFLKNLFLKMDARHDRFHECFSFSLRFLEESQKNADLFQSLKQHKQRCLQHLQQNDRLEAYRRNHNIETLMAHGIRIPYTDKQALLIQITLVDDISLALFNQSM
ncbi:hypothetical protein N9C84_03515 [Desulfobacterales bacterium]|nr:hypothetical protein [Desulfobacterales bacterium]